MLQLGAKNNSLVRRYTGEELTSFNRCNRLRHDPEVSGILLTVQILIALASLITLAIPELVPSIRNPNGRLNGAGRTFSAVAAATFALTVISIFMANAAQEKSDRELSAIRLQLEQESHKLEPKDFHIFVFSLGTPPFHEKNSIEQALNKGTLSRPTSIQVIGRLGSSNPLSSVPISLDLVAVPAHRLLMRRIGGYLDFTYEARNLVMLAPNTFPYLANLKGQRLTLTLPIDKLEFFKAEWVHDSSLYIKDKRYNGLVNRSSGVITFDFDQAY